MGSNKNKREELERIYGKGSMFQKSHTEDYVSTLPIIKGYKKFLKEKHYTSKEIKRLQERMNYHHLQHKSEGGQTSLENGAVVTEGEHRYIHSLPREQEEIINNHIRQWKIDYISLSAGQVIDSGEIDIDLSKDYIEIPAHEYHSTKQFTIKELQEKQRRKEKRDFERLRKEWEDR